MYNIVVDIYFFMRFPEVIISSRRREKNFKIRRSDGTLNIKKRTNLIFTNMKERRYRFVNVVAHVRELSGVHVTDLN